MRLLSFVMLPTFDLVFSWQDITTCVWLLDWVENCPIAKWPTLHLYANFNNDVINKCTDPLQHGFALGGYG